MNDFLSVVLPWIFLIGLAWLLVRAVSGKRSRRRSRSGPRRRRTDAPRKQGRRLPDRPVQGRVTRVSDGDSLEAQVPGLGRLRIRLAYVDAPELDQPGGRESREALARLLQGAKPQFRLLYRDQYGRAVAIVSVKDIVCNEQLVRMGHAWAYDRHLPKRLRARYKRLQGTAQTSGAGLWGARTRPVPPWEWRHR